MEDFEREIKVVVVGNGGVGKTSMIKRFCKGVYTDEYKKTIGVDFLEKVQYVPTLGEDVRLFLWDTAGQEEFDSITKTYYRGAGAAVLAFSTTDRTSFEAVAKWKAKVAAECGDIAMVLVQNKVDLLDKAAVTSEEAEGMARRLGLKFYRTCVKENLNVTEVFTYLAELHDKKVASGQLAPEPAAQPIEPMTTPVLEPGEAPSAADRNNNGWSGGGASTQKAQQVMPTTIDLQPSKKRGKKKPVYSKVKKLFTCSIQ